MALLVEEYATAYVVTEQDVIDQIDNSYCVDKMMSHLEALDRKIIYLYYFKDKTLQQISIELGITATRVYNHLSKALRKGRFYLKK